MCTIKTSSTMAGFLGLPVLLYSIFGIKNVLGLLSDSINGGIVTAFILELYHMQMAHCSGHIGLKACMMLLLLGLVTHCHES